MDAKATAPTITIDGVTSKPAEPVTMTLLACDCAPSLLGHDIAVGDIMDCDDCDIHTTVKRVFPTWVF